MSFLVTKLQPNHSAAANSATVLVLQIVGHWRGVAGRNVSAVNIERHRCPIDVRMNAPIYTQRSQQLNTRAFTVVELLVVIGIIVLLGALLLPALSRAKAQGQSASCKNHLRQIGLAMAMYVADHNRYPPLWGRGETWADKLQIYAPLNWTNTAWHCPTYIANKGIVEFVKPPEGGGEFVQWTSYGYNAYGVAGNRRSLGLGLGVLQPWAAREPEVKAPSQMYVVADARAYKWDALPGPAGEPAMNPWLLSAGIVTPEAAPPHSQCYNILFGDGHVVSVKRRDYLFPPRTAQNWNKDNQPHPEAWAPKTQWAVQN